MSTSHILTSLVKDLGQAFESLGVSVPETLSLERPANPEFGDFACTFALTAFGKLTAEQKQTVASPRALAQQVVSNLADQPILASVSVAGPGFINFRLKEKVLWQLLATSELIPAPSPGGLSAIVEYVSPNTNKPLHIGHLRNAALGSSLANLLETQGYSVERTAIFNDRGLHIMKSAWSYLTLGEKSHTEVGQLKNGLKTDEVVAALTSPERKHWSASLSEWNHQPQLWLVPQDMTELRLQKPDHFVGYWYQLADACAEDVGVTAEWGEMLRAWEDDQAPEHGELLKLWQQLNAWFYEGFAQTKTRFGFELEENSLSYESRMYQLGKQIVLEQAQKGVFEKLPDGAIKVDLSRYHLPDKILLRKDGTSIYMTFDLELTRQRAATGADELFWVVGADQILSFKQLFAIAEMIGLGNPEKFTHVAYGMVRLPEGKMSSRKGLVIYADDLIDQAVERAKEIMEESNLKKELSATEFEAIAQAVGIGAIKWTMLSVDATSEITFNLAESISFKGFAGPYVQYTHARARSVLRKASDRSITVDYDLLLNNVIDSIGQETVDPAQASEIALLRNLVTYYETVKYSSLARSPHHLAVYLYELCQLFNGFYAACSVLGETVPAAVTNRRLALVNATAMVLRHGLTVLGIEAVEKM